MNQSFQLLPFPIPDAQGIAAITGGKTASPSANGPAVAGSDFAALLTAESAKPLVGSALTSNAAEINVAAETLPGSLQLLDLLPTNDAAALPPEISIPTSGLSNVNPDIKVLNGELMLAAADGPTISELATLLAGDESAKSIQLLPSAGAQQQVDPEQVITLSLPDGTQGEFLPMQFMLEQSEVTGDDSSQTLLLPIARDQYDTPQIEAGPGLLVIDSGMLAQIDSATPVSADNTENRAQLLLPISLNLNESQLEKLNVLLTATSQAEPRSLQPLPIGSELTAAQQNQIVGTASTDGSLPELLAPYAGEMQIESMSVQLQFDPEKLMQWLQAVTGKKEMPLADVNQANPLVEKQQLTIEQLPAKPDLLQQSQPDRPTELQVQPTAAATREFIAKEFTIDAAKEQSLFRSGDESSSEMATSSVVAAGTGEKTLAVTNQAPNSVLATAAPAYEVPEPQRFRMEFDRRQIESLLKQGEVRLKLNPPELGQMKIELISKADEVSARFEIHSQAARRIIEFHLPQLRENLARAGVRVDHVEVVVDNDSGRRQHPGYAEQQARAFNRPATADNAAATMDHDYPVTDSLRAGSLNLLV